MDAPPPNDPPVAFDAFADSVRAFAARDLAAALRHARQGQAAAPGETLYADAARFLERAQGGGDAALYAEADAFSAFIGGGGNLPLYDSARALLVARLRELRPQSLLDIGTGEGTVVVPVTLALESCPALTLCEPSLALLERATRFAAESGLAAEAYPLPIEDMLDEVPGLWDVAIATWSLQNLPRAARATVLQTLAGRVGRLFVAEFDDPSGHFADPLDPARIRHIHDRYLVGLREYPGEAGRRVRLGFLMPVLYGYFAHDGRRSTHEQPIALWEAELREAGFTETTRSLIYPYWWADAFLIEAKGAG